MSKIITIIKKEIFYWKLRFKNKTQSEIKYYRQFYVDKYLARTNIVEAFEGYTKFDNDMSILLNAKQEQIDNLKQEIYLLNEQIRKLSN